LTRIRGIIFDLDGVIYRGDSPLPHAAKAVAAVRAAGMRIAFLTNNSTEHREVYCERLRAMGIPCEVQDVMSSGYATVLWLQEQCRDGCRVHVVGEDGLRRELREGGFTLVTDQEPADFVVAGMDRNFGFKTLLDAQQVILKGARLIATNRDATFPVEGGVRPGGGTMIAALETCTGAKALTIGKPETYTLEKVLQGWGLQPVECALVGDRLDTDILLANRLGMLSIMVLTGAHTRQQADAAPEEMRPKVIINDLSELEGTVGG
jgi:phosphoglycolate/pyridoxal phosphate phosphatase family enzyme